MLMRNPPLCPFSFINKEATGCINEESIRAINEAAVDAIIAPGHPRSCFFISCFTVSVAPSINRPNFFSDPTTLISESFSCSGDSLSTYFSFKFI